MCVCVFAVEEYGDPDNQTGAIKTPAELQSAAGPTAPLGRKTGLLPAIVECRGSGISSVGQTMRGLQTTVSSPDAYCPFGFAQEQCRAFPEKAAPCVNRVLYFPHVDHVDELRGNTDQCHAV